MCSAPYYCAQYNNTHTLTSGSRSSDTLAVHFLARATSRFTLDLKFLGPLQRENGACRECKTLRRRW